MSWRTLGAWAETGPEACGVILADDLGRVALQLRDDFANLKGAGHFAFFGGHREAGETLAETAVREMTEETGITFSVDEIRPFARAVSSRGTRIYMFETDRLFAPKDICVGEGAGFAFLTLAQTDNLPCLDPAGRILSEWHISSNSRNNSLTS